MLNPLQRRDLRLLAALSGASLLGDFVALTALYLRLAPHGHAWAIAALAIAGSLPLVLLAPLAGQVVDRVAARGLLVVLGLAEAVVCVGIGRFHGLVATLGLMALLSSLVAVSAPGYSALAPTIAGEDNVARAQSLLQATRGAASVVGPVVGGLLVGASGQSAPLYVDAASFALAAVATTWLRHDRRPSARSTIDEVRGAGAMAGVVLVWRDRLLRPVVTSVAAFMLALGMINVAEVFFITRTLHGSPTLYGLVGTSFGAGTVIGSLAARRLAPGAVHLARAVLVALAVIGVLMGLVGLATGVAWVYPPLVASGVAVGVANVAVMTLLTVRTPEATRGRMFAAVGAIFTSCEIGAMALGGLALTFLAPRTIFQVAGVVSTLSALVLGPPALRASRQAHARERDGDPPDPDAPPG